VHIEIEAVAGHPRLDPPRLELPEVSLSKRVRASTFIESRDAVDADIWFSEEHDGILLEKVRHLTQWDLT
jgi:hypothetical protein